jgi:peptidoglycan/xylan/chitin deacetylase (PgdA/CDA1 family)
MGNSLERKLVILIYHRVLDAPDPLRPYEIDRDTFTRQLQGLRRWHNVISLREGVWRLNEGSLPGRAVAITFDDGYRDNLTNAMPLLQAAGMTATIFVATGFTGRGAMFNDLIIEAVHKCRGNSIEVPGSHQIFDLGNTVDERRRAVGRILEYVKYLPLAERQQVAESIADANGVDNHEQIMMSQSDIRDVWRSGMDIGAHTVRHPILSNLDDVDAQSEIQNSKLELEEIIDAKVAGFAYPNGKLGRDFDKRDAELAKQAGFEYAVTTDWAAASRKSDLFYLPRISIGARTGFRPLVTTLKAGLLG